MEMKIIDCGSSVFELLDCAATRQDENDLPRNFSLVHNNIIVLFTARSLQLTLN